MHRRTFVAATASAVGLAGCLAPVAGDPEQTTEPPAKPGATETRTGATGSSAPTKPGATETPVRMTAEGVAASFRVVDGHAPTDATAGATFDGARVVVTGTMDPAGCRRPALSSVRFDAASDTVHLVVGTAARYGETATVECGNASFDYRSVVTVADGTPTTVTVVHDHHDGDDRTFTLERA